MDGETVLARFVDVVTKPPLALYDIGVGAKTEVLALHAIFPGMEVFGCEPHPKTYAALVADGFPGDLENVALGRTPGRRKLYLADDPQASSLLTKDVAESVPVQVDTLDGFDQRAGKPERIILWADCEGSELEILRGGLELLESGRVWWVNLEEAKRRRHAEMGERGVKGWARRAEILHLLRRYGYKRVLEYNPCRTHVDVIYLSGECRAAIAQHCKHVLETLKLAKRVWG